MAAHQRDAQSHGRSGFPVAGLLQSPSGQQVSLPEEPHGFCSAELRPMSTLDVLEHYYYWLILSLCWDTWPKWVRDMLLFIGPRSRWLASWQGH